MGSGKIIKNEISGLLCKVWPSWILFLVLFIIIVKRFLLLDRLGLRDILLKNLNILKNSKN